VTTSGIRENGDMTVSTLVLQRRREGPRADALLDELQESVPVEQRVRWDESGHARLEPHGELERERETVAARLQELDGDWNEHITIL
jgi:hypothetical protein